MHLIANQTKYGQTKAAHNEEKSVVVERFIRTIKNKIYKYMKKCVYQ